MGKRWEERIEDSKISYVTDVVEYKKIIDKIFKDEIDREGIVLK